MAQARKKALFSAYGQHFNRTVLWCLEDNPKDRPDAYTLYRSTKHWMQHWRTKAEAEAAMAGKHGYYPQCFPSSVLYTREDQRRYETDPDFAAAYRRGNLARIRETFEPVPAVQSNTYVPEISESLKNKSMEWSTRLSGRGGMLSAEQRESRLRRQERHNRIHAKKRNGMFGGIVKRLASAWTANRRY